MLISLWQIITFSILTNQWFDQCCFKFLKISLGSGLIENSWILINYFCILCVAIYFWWSTKKKKNTVLKRSEHGNGKSILIALSDNFGYSSLLYQNSECYLLMDKLQCAIYNLIGTVTLKFIHFVLWIDNTKNSIINIPIKFIKNLYTGQLSNSQWQYKFSKL